MTLGLLPTFCTDTNFSKSNPLPRLWPFHLVSERWWDLMTGCLRPCLNHHPKAICQAGNIVDPIKIDPLTLPLCFWFLIFRVCKSKFFQIAWKKVFLHSVLGTPLKIHPNFLLRKIEGWNELSGETSVWTFLKNLEILQ